MIIQHSIFDFVLFLLYCFIMYSLGPGEMLAVRLDEGKVYLNDEIKTRMANKRPYSEWVKNTIAELPKGSFQQG